MAVPSSGQLREYADIGTELGVAQSNVSLRGMSQTAGFSAPDAMSEFYGYSSLTPTDNFKTIVYTGNAQDPYSITGLSFKPSLVFIFNQTLDGYPKFIFYEKSLNSIWKLFTNKRNSAVDTSTDDEMRSFDSNGFTLGDDGQVNKLNIEQVGHCFKAGDSFVTNNNGSISSSVSSNPNGGFSIVRWTGTGSAGSVGHGLDSTPDLIITKSEERSEWWGVQTSISGVWEYGVTRGDLASTEVSKDGTNTVTSANSSSFSIGTHPDINLNNRTFVAFCFKNIDNYLKIDTYVGTGSNRSVDVGFPIRFLWIKEGCKTGDSAGGWLIIDSTIGTGHINVTTGNYFVDLNLISFSGNGFNILDGSSINILGDTHLYMAIA